MRVCVSERERERKRTMQRNCPCRGSHRMMIPHAGYRLGFEVVPYSCADTAQQELRFPPVWRIFRQDLFSTCGSCSATKFSIMTCPSDSNNCLEAAHSLSQQWNPSSNLTTPGGVVTNFGRRRANFQQTRQATPDSGLGMNRFDLKTKLIVKNHARCSLSV